MLLTNSFKVPRSKNTRSIYCEYLNNFTDPASRLGLPPEDESFGVVTMVFLLDPS